MKILNKLSSVAGATLLLFSGILISANGGVVFADNIAKVDPGFEIPNLSTVLSFAIRLIFIIGGLSALVFLLLGALAWITSGGEKEKVSEAQKKIQAAVIGVIMIAVVLTVVVTLEQVVFGRAICFGLSCDIVIPPLIHPNH